MTEPDLEVLDGPATRAILADLGTRPTRSTARLIETGMIAALPRPARADVERVVMGLRLRD